MAEICHVCDKPMSGKDIASCDNCSKEFHLAMTINSPTEDCGRVFNHPEDQYLVFLCSSCDPLQQPKLVLP